MFVRFAAELMGYTKITSREGTGKGKRNHTCVEAVHREIAGLFVRPLKMSLAMQRRPRPHLRRHQKVCLSADSTLHPVERR
jgi:hypothetical protein